MHSIAAFTKNLLSPHFCLTLTTQFKRSPVMVLSCAYSCLNLSSSIGQVNLYRESYLIWKALPSFPKCCLL